MDIARLLRARMAFVEADKTAPREEPCSSADSQAFSSATFPHIKEPPKILLFTLFRTSSSDRARAREPLLRS